jgi:CheY-like chemotaxis protein
MPDTKASLLIVDDEPSIRMSLSCLFKAIGYRVRTAEDGLSALIKIGEDVPDILLSDLQMPGMSGFELLAAVRSRFPGLRTIAMSGAFCGEEIPSGVAADAFCPKGGGAGLLLKMVETLSQRQPTRDDSAGARHASEHVVPVFQPGLAGLSLESGALQTINS